jgi:hypothetical protein
VKKLLAIACLLSVLTLSVFGQLRILQERTFRPQLQHSLYLTNAQKLSLPANTPVGTEIMVSDWEAAGLAGPHQRLKAPSTAQGGVFVVNNDEGLAALNQGIFTKRGQVNGKDYFDLLGYEAADGHNEVAWNIVDPGAETPVYRWEISGVTLALVYSLSDVATPDLASNWKNVSGDSPASITVTSVSVGELVAGVLVAGAGTTTANDVYVGVNESPIFYRAVNGSDWIENEGADVGGFVFAIANGVFLYQKQAAAFPFSAGVWTSPNGTPPAPTVARNDVASEANWEVIP